MSSRQLVYVDVIVPVHNAEETVEETVRSAMHQIMPDHLVFPAQKSSVQVNEFDIDLAVSCYDDGSTDESWNILCGLKEEYETRSWSNDVNELERASEGPKKAPRPHTTDKKNAVLNSKLFIDSAKDGIARGAGYARNQAVALRCNQSTIAVNEEAPYFLCLIDSDDTMHCTRVAEQLYAMFSIPEKERRHTLLGCNFNRIPPDSTWHYAKWANNLRDERLILERYREVTILQPTWFMSKSRFTELGGYIEAPDPILSESSSSAEEISKLLKDDRFRLIHPTYDTSQTLRLAEDLRFFHEHLCANGLLRLHRTETPLVMYRHRAGFSQSSQTPRKLLLHLRMLAFERTVLRSDPTWLKNDGRFVIWGAGRDGKDFVKALSKDLRCRVACFVDVDYKKISAGSYVNKDLDVSIPIVHFSMLVANPETRQDLLHGWESDWQSNNGPSHGRINKGARPSNTEGKATPSVSKKRSNQRQNSRPVKRLKLPEAGEIDTTLLPELPVVVCVAMYRTQGVLEKNVRSIGRTEGIDLWHFS